MIEWEYKVVIINTLVQPTLVEWLGDEDPGSAGIQKILDSMGNEGWELIDFIPARPADFMWIHPTSKHESAISANPWLYHAIFKRHPETAEERRARVERERIERHLQKANERT